MDTSNTYSKEEYDTQAELASEFGSWPCDAEKIKALNEVKAAFDQLLKKIEKSIPSYNGRYLAMVRTDLEVACMKAVKGISRPEGSNEGR